MNDGLSLTRIVVFFSALPVANAVASVASSVRSPLTISSSGITATGLKKWKPDDPLGVLEVGGHLGDRQRGGVGRQDALGRDGLLDVGEDLLLDRHLLEDRLDDEVGVGEAPRLVDRAGDQRLVPVGLVGADPALGEQLVDLGVDVAHALVDALLVEVGEHDRHLEAAYEQQRELAGHQAGADDADLGHRARQRPVRRAGGALGPLLHQVEGVERRRAAPACATSPRGRRPRRRSPRHGRRRGPPSISSTARCAARARRHRSSPRPRAPALGDARRPRPRRGRPRPGRP